MKKAEAISILATSVRPREAKDRARYDKAVKMAIEALNCSEFPNNSDTISRQAAIDALADMHCKSDEDGYVWIIRSDAWARIDALPSAQPERKKGEWISNDIDPEAWNFCSVCGEQAIDLFDFCPNCGADMRGEQE